MKSFTLFFAITLLFFSKKGFTQDLSNQELPRTNKWGIGLTVVNSGGVSIKRYLGDNALEFTVGRYNPWNSYSFAYRDYKNRFDEYNVSYGGYDDIINPIKFQLRYLKHKQISWAKGLTWYYGAGVQTRIAKGNYRISRIDGFYRQVEKYKYTYLGIGADIALGLEYTFNKIPISLFGDTGFYTEGFPKPFYIRRQTSLGGRYNF